MPEKAQRQVCDGQGVPERFGTGIKKDRRRRPSYGVATQGPRQTYRRTPGQIASGTPVAHWCWVTQY